METTQAILQEIESTTKFTSDYWWPLLVQAESDPDRTKLRAKVIHDIIEKRGQYVRSLELEFDRIKSDREKGK